MDELSRPEIWERFYEYKTGLACPKRFAKELRDFIDRRAYEPVCGAIRRGEPFPLPGRAVISKMSTQKKRVVYCYPSDENTVLKLLTWLLLRRYDGIFADNLYSFRPGRAAKDAVRRLRTAPGIRGMYAYKADISNYFNSVPVEALLPRLEEVLRDDPALFAFLKALLTEPAVLENGKPVTEQKGIMAGTPLSAFYANLYLRELDLHFEALGVPYARYSDDIIVFAPTREGTERHAAFVREFLAAAGLTLNPDKERFSSPEEGWTYLGFYFRDGVTDLAPASLTKMKQKMRRKTRALERWRKRNELDREKAAKAFIRVFNSKLFENPADNDLTWAYWYFPVLTTADGLREIDLYAQDCLRCLLTGARTKARYNARYEDLKQLGYRSLVHEYYAFRESAKE
ncbi:MAG: group II intron reverse transcriptase domain-containing protein [Clostridia bacterium]|nr:group II intron reverse transcriptase domain-containing protein [Clostridia bacterium]